MKTKTNNKNQNTPKTKPSAKDKALAKVVRTKFICAIQDMANLCRENGLSFEISGWVEDPVDRGDTPEKTLKFQCGKGYVCPMLVHEIVGISRTLHEGLKACSYNEVVNLCTMAENLIGYVCNKVMTNLNKKMENNSKTKEK